VTTNRIQQYERLWTDAVRPSSGVPQGFAMIALGHLTPTELAALDARRTLYQWAYDQARADAEARSIHDWII
jgi:hypothetical protein